MEDCFIICPLGNDTSETRKRSDTLLKHIFQPVLDSYGISAQRADQVPKVGIITTQIINLIIECDLVIADLTDANPNVFYELAIRHAIRKPYIQVIAKGQKIPFDLSAIRTIEIDISDLDSVENAKREIGNHIVEFRKGHIPDSPISVASSARLVQNDSDLAEKVADRLSNLYYYEGPVYRETDNDKLDEISRKLYGFNEFSLINLEELSTKLDRILDKLEGSNKTK